MRKNTFRVCLLFLLALSCIFLPACAALEGIMGKLGFDMHDYRGEAVVTTHAADGEIAASLSEMLRPLTLSSPELTPFSGTREAANAYRDTILNHMLEDGYARYAGNSVLLKRAAAAYPHLQLNVLIPADDFETTAYALFGGGEKIANKSGVLFTYLDRVDAYTTAALPRQSEVITETVLLEETERTYRLYFTNMLDGTASPMYFALIIKREDGSLYIRELSETEKLP